MTSREMTKEAKLPDDLKHSKCKRGDLAKQGDRIPPIHFIRRKATLDKEAATATIYTLCKVKEEFTKYSGSNTKLAVMHIRLFKSILDKCNFRKEQEVAQLILNNLQQEYDALDTRASAHSKKLEQELDKAWKEVKGYCF